MTRTAAYARAYTEFMVNFWAGGDFNSEAWLNQFEEKDSLSIAEKFALVHPDFWGHGLLPTRKDRRKYHPIRRNASFSKVAEKRKCATVDCEWEGQILTYEAGHIWPDKFGGPEISLNSECQCFTCNRMASYSIEDLPWEKWEETPPRWLEPMMKSISIQLKAQFRS